MNKELIETFLLRNNLISYDPYDIWKTSLGIGVKKFYYKNKRLGIMPAGLLNLFDFYINNTLRVFYKKHEYPIVRAQAALALLTLYKKDYNKKYLDYAKKHIDWLLNNYSKGYSGYCWGLGFTWVYSANEVYNENTPFSTHTPYPLEAFVTYYQLTNDERLLKPIKSIFHFLEHDLKIMFEDDEKLIISYGTNKDRIVTNANSYVMYMYALLLDFFPEKDEYIKEKIKRLYNFLVSVQKEDGSWLYSPYDDKSFIDCFHSCFVVKNIFKTNKIIRLNESSSVIEKGFNYIKSNFIDIKYFLFKRFTKSNKPSLVKFDLYDNAETLSLAVLLNDVATIAPLEKSIRRYFIKNNVIYSTIDILGFKRNSNHLRWAVTPYLYALSTLAN